MTLESPKYLPGDRVILSDVQIAEHGILKYAIVKEKHLCHRVTVVAIDSTTNKEKELVIHVINLRYCG